MVELGDPVPFVYLRSGVVCLGLCFGLGLVMLEPAGIAFCFHTLAAQLDTAFDSREGTCAWCRVSPGLAPEAWWW